MNHVADMCYRAIDMWKIWHGKESGMPRLLGAESGSWCGRHNTPVRDG